MDETLLAGAFVTNKHRGLVQMALAAYPSPLCVGQ